MCLVVIELNKESLRILMVKLEGDPMAVKAEGALREASKESISLPELPWQVFRALQRVSEFMMHKVVGHASPQSASSRYTYIYQQILSSFRPAANCAIKFRFRTQLLRHPWSRISNRVAWFEQCLP